MNASARPRSVQILLGAARWIGVGLFLAFVGVSAFQIAFRWQRRVTTVSVPDLKGLNREEAARAATDAGLALEVAGERNDPAVPSGRVLQQGPRPGSLVRRKRRIQVVMSLGQQELTVPEVVGRPAREASVRIRQEGLEPGDEARVHTRAAPDGVVFGQWPPAGSPAVRGTSVHRLVSAGPHAPRWVMQDLTGRPLDAAVRWAEQSGLRKGKVHRIGGSTGSGEVVVGQWPLAGYPVRPRAIVEFTVAR